jgi:NitT/TauT family transport system substrate-binding protein
VLSVGAAPAMAQDAEGMTKINYTFDWLPDGDWAPALWCEENGTFVDAGLDVSYQAGTGSSDALPLIALGQMDMGQISGPPLVLGLTEGLPVTAVGVQMAATPLVLLADADAGIVNIEDLEGKRVAVQQGEFEGAVWDSLVVATGLDISTIEEVPAAGGADILFIDKQVDAFMDFYTSGAMVALTDGREGNETLFLVRDFVDILGHTTVVNNDFMAQNPDAVQAFTTAWANCMKFAIDNPEATVDLILEKFPENSRPDTEWSVARYIETWIESGAEGGLMAFTPELWESTQAVAALVVPEVGDIDITTAYTTDLLPDPPVAP